MKQSKPSATITLDTRRPKKGGKFPPKLRVTMGKVSRYYKVPLPDFSVDEWEKISLGKFRSDDYRKRKTEISAIEVEAANFIDVMPEFSFDAFKSGFFDKQGVDKHNVYTAMQQYADDLTSEGRHGTASSILSSMKSLRSFDPSLAFEHLTVKWLKQYHDWMRKNGKSDTTVGIYLRALQSVFNLAINQGVVSKDSYPFGKRKFKIPAARNIKKALTLEEVRSINAYKVIEGSFEEKAKDFWMFTYFAGGINIKDILNLKWANLKGDVLTYVRQKSQRTAKVQEPIVLTLNSEALEIIERQGSDLRGNDDFIFPVLEKGMDSERMYRRSKDFTKFVNNRMAQIGKDLKIEKPLTTYVARHSFATIMIRLNASPMMVSKAIGHGGNTKTTLNYIGEIDLDVKREFASKLI